MKFLSMTSAIRNLRPGMLLGAALFPLLLTAQPVVNLGPDFAACGSAVLDAGNPGSTYLWSTGATSQTITATTSGSYWVEASNGSGVDRDTVAVLIVATPGDPVLSNVTTCGTVPVTLSSNTSAQLVAWYDSPVGGAITASGPTITRLFSNTTTLYVEAHNFGQPQSAGRLSPVQGNYYFIGDARGMLFNVLEPVFLESVKVYTSGVVTGNMDLISPQGTVLFTTAISFPQGGGNLVNINSALIPGTGYLLRLRNLTGNVSIDFPVSFPLTYPGIVLTGGSAVASHYNYFFDWRVRPLLCNSNRLPVNVTVLPTPNVNLGKDSSLCGSSILLDGGNPGATFLWNTGQTTQTIQASSSGLYWMQASLGNCIDRDSIVVAIVAAPSDPVINDTSVCAIPVTLSSNTNADLVAWFDSPTGGNIVATGSNINKTFIDTTTLYVEAQNFGLSQSVGRTSPNQGTYFFIGETRGMLFNVVSPLILESVKLYTSGVVTGIVDLLGPQGDILFTTSVSFPQSGGNIVNIGKVLSPGTGYLLRLRNMTGNVSIDLPVNFPLSYPGIVLTGGSVVPSHYNYFYDWKIKQALCYSNRIPITINVLNTPVVDLGRDTALCGNSLILDAGYPGASYIWNDGSSNATYQVQNTQTSYVTATVGICSVSDSIDVVIASIPPEPMVLDQTICGSGIYTFSAQSALGSSVWFDSPTGGNNIGIGENLDAYILDSQVLYVEAQQFYPDAVGALLNIGSPSGNNFLISDERGLRFDVTNPIRLDEVTFRTGGVVQGKYMIRNPQGEIIYSITLNNSGTDSIVIPVGVLLPQGNGYEMAFKSLGASVLRIDYPINYPIVNEDFRITEGFPVSSHYNYFYRWKTSIGFCNSTRKPLNITVRLPFDLPDSIYSCDPVILDADNPSATHLWSTGETSESITVTNTGVYTVTVSDNTGCVVTDTSFVEIPQNAGLPEDGILCGNTLFTNYGINAEHIWSTGDTTSTINITQPGTYFVQVLEPQGCLLTDTINVSGFSAFPDVEVGPDRFACVSVELDAGVPGQQYLWNTGATTQTITVTSSGSYWVVVTNLNGCSGSDTVGLFIEPEPISDFIYNTVGYEVSFINVSPIFASYTWLFGDGTSTTDFNPVHVYNDTGLFFVSLVAVNQCGIDTFTQAVRIRGTSAVEDDLARAGIFIGPNPASEHLNIVLKQVLKDQVFLQIFDLAGKAVLLQELDSYREVQQINISSLSSGIYTARILWGEYVGQTHILISR